jgi:hypothetical protein
MAMWNGFSWVTLDISTGSGPNPRGITMDGVGNIFITSNEEFGNINSAGMTTITNLGSADANLIFEISGPGTIYTIFNETTGDKLWFDLTLTENEKAILSLGNNPSFLSTFSGFSGESRWGVMSSTPGIYSVFPITAINVTGPGRGNIISTILPGSNLNSFHLAPGVNKISCLVAGVTDVKKTFVNMYYKPTYWGVQDASGVSK